LTSSEKDSDRIAAYMMNPAFLFELSHASVNPWKAGFSLLFIFFCQCLDSNKASFNYLIYLFPFKKGLLHDMQH